MNANEPLVAVVTPIYNGERYLRETMDCVQAQTYRNVIHIVLDNASTDATPAILRDYENAAFPVRVSRNVTCLSLSLNWNAAVTLVPPEAKYFRVLCADDIMAPEFLSKTVAVGERHRNVGLVGCRLHVNNEPAFPTQRTPDREVFSGRETLRDYFGSQFWNWIPTGHCLYRTTELARRKPFFPGNVILSDLGASIEVLLESDLGFVHEDLGMTRMHAVNQTNSVVRPAMMSLCEHYYFARRYGPLVLSETDAREALRLYERFYFRKMVRWALTGKHSLFQRHKRRLAELGVEPPAWKYVDAVVDWPIARFNLRPKWDGYYAERFHHQT